VFFFFYCNVSNWYLGTRVVLDKNGLFPSINEPFSAMMGLHYFKIKSSHSSFLT
jgi:hypothetical protein